MSSSAIYSLIAESLQSWVAATDSACLATVEISSYCLEIFAPYSFFSDKTLLASCLPTEEARPAFGDTVFDTDEPSVLEPVGETSLVAGEVFNDARPGECLAFMGVSG